VVAASVAVLLAGAVAFAKLPLATRTAVELPRLQVTASWPGASAELVESWLTAPLEGAAQAVRGVRKVSSESTDGLARLTLELDPAADVRLARLAILERIELLRPELPPGATSPAVSNFVPEDLEEQPLLEYTLSGPYTPGTLQRLVDERIAPRVSAVAGVAGVERFGGAEVGVSVTYDAARLRALGVTPQDLLAALRGARVVEAVGEERRGAARRQVTLRDQPGALAELEALPVPGPGGAVHRLGDLAAVRADEDTRDRVFRLDGEPAVALSIARLPGADAIRTAAGVRAALAALGPLLPPGVRLTLQSDESRELGGELRDLVRRGLAALAAVLVVLAVTLRHARAVTLVTAAALVAIAGTALGLFLLRIPANLLTLAGLGMGIGILVQNGVVVVERLLLAPDGRDARAGAAATIAPAVAGATLTTAVVLAPFLYLQGNARAAFMPFAAAFALALGWSVVTALVLVPAVGLGRHRAPPRWRALDRGYARTLAALFRWRGATLVVSLLVLAGLGWGFATRVPRGSWGSWFGQRTTVSASVRFPRGSDPVALDRALRDFERLVVGVPGVEQVRTMGGPDGGYLSVVFEREAGYGALPYAVQDELTQRALLVGGAAVSVVGRGPGFSAGGVGGGAMTFRIKILGYSFAGVEGVARDLEARLRRIPRVRDVDIHAGSFFRAERGANVTLVPDRAALARHGLAAGDFARAVSREVQGAVGSERIEIDGEELPLRLKAAGARTRTMAELEAAIVPVRGGAPVRVGDLARVEERQSLSSISREEQQYVRVVSYDFRGPPKLANRTHEAFMRATSVPAGYTVADDWFSFAQDDSARGLWLVFGVGVALVLLAVAVVFDSAWAAVMVLLSLPLAFAGVAAAFWGTGTSFGREAAVGVILVVGLSVNQAILLVDGVLARRRRTAAAAYRAARDRAGMIVLVTLTTLASLVPLAVGTAPDSLFGAIALATAGGTVAATLGTMLVLPLAIGGGRRCAPRPTPG